MPVCVRALLSSDYSWFHRDHESPFLVRARCDEARRCTRARTRGEPAVSIIISSLINPTRGENYAKLLLWPKCGTVIQGRLYFLGHINEEISFPGASIIIVSMCLINLWLLEEKTRSCFYNKNYRSLIGTWWDICEKELNPLPCNYEGGSRFLGEFDQSQYYLYVG